MSSHWPAADLGHGVGLRHTHFNQLLEDGPHSVGWFEIISENFFEPGGRPWRVLERVRQDLPVVMHGVSMGVGNAHRVPRRYLDQLKTVIDRIEPAWVSDHLCWGGYEGKHAHDLLPLPCTEEALHHVARQVREVQEVLGRRILLENPSSYVAFCESTMPEWEFLLGIAEEADCGILLDINNIFVSAHNHDFSAEQYLNHLPHQRIGQFHLAGHTDQGDYLFDSHIGPVSDPVWDLYRKAVERFGPVPTLIEWDEDIPAYDVVIAESARAAAIEAEVLAERAKQSGKKRGAR